jgi:hypothetical protein
MVLDEHVRYCPKCDNRLDLQTDGSVITRDIAHHGERVHDALRKMRSEITQSKKGTAQYLRLVVGSGVIRDEVMAALADLKRRQVVLFYDLESGNSGAIRVKLKP